MSDTIHHYNCVDGAWFHAGDCPGCEIERLRAEVDQQKRWGLEAHERAGGVEERLRTELDLANGRLDEKSKIICDMNRELAEKDRRIEELEMEIATAKKITDLLLEHRHGWEKKDE